MRVRTHARMCARALAHTQTPVGVLTAHSHQLNERKKMYCNGVARCPTATPVYKQVSIPVSDTVISQSPRAHLHVVGMLRFVSDVNQPSLPTPFYSVLVSVSVFKALSTVLHSINSPNSSLSHSVLLVLILLYRSFQLCISL